MSRKASLERNTAETQIKLTLALDGEGTSKLETGIAFFDHMLTLFSRHGLFDLEVLAKGDLDVDFHHTVEDIGIVLGQAFLKALGDKKGINRYGSSYVPMDETLARVVVDLSGRSYLVYRVPASVEPIGNFSFQLVEEFLRAFSANAAMNLHVEILYGRDAHHMAEAIFKALANALDHAVRIDGRVKGIPSTKGVL
ncbi:MAG: imidazoleglycerol-phosphate dehydratase HisB [Chthoniobacterales bacterium]